MSDGSSRKRRSETIMVVPPAASTQHSQLRQQQHPSSILLGESSSSHNNNNSNNIDNRRRIVVRIKRYHGVAKWSWNANDDVCGICQTAFEGAAPGIRYVSQLSRLIPFFQFVELRKFFTTGTTPSHFIRRLSYTGSSRLTLYTL